MTIIQLDLEFTRTAAGTRLMRHRVAYPYAVTGVFETHDRGLEVTPQAVSGGLFAGDRLVERITVGAGAVAVIRDQGARVTHASRDGATAQLTREFHVAAGGRLTLWGQPMVQLPGSLVETRTRIVLATGGWLAWCDLFGAHRPEGAPPLPARLTSHLCIARPNVAPAAEQAFQTEHPADGGRWVGTALLLGEAVPDPEPIVCVGGYGGWDPLPGGIGLAAQVIGPSAAAVQAALWAVLAPQAAGQLAGRPPVIA